MEDVVDNRKPPISFFTGQQQQQHILESYHRGITNILSQSSSSDTEMYGAHPFGRTCRQFVICFGLASQSLLLFGGRVAFSSLGVFGLTAPSNPKGDLSWTSEETMVNEQLGYLPTNFVCVSAWTTRTRQPIAIKTYPLQGGSRRRQSKAVFEPSSVQSPFPTLYWLTNPDIGECLGNLERLGCIQDCNAKLHADPDLVSRLWRCHRQYAEQRWGALSMQDQAFLRDATEPALVSMRGIMRDSGISGSNLTLTEEGLIYPAIKCLHAHYAHYRSTRDMIGYEVNPVGEMIHEQLKQEFPDLEL